MDYFYELYARYILERTVELGEDDVLSINTAEEYVPFARLLAKEAKERSGNGSYLVMLEKGKAREAVEIYSDYMIEKAPTVFIYLQGREEEPEFIDHKLYSAREAQLFSHLSDPLMLPEAEVAFITVPMPNKVWASKLYESCSEKNLSAMISDFLLLGSGNGQGKLKEAISVEKYDLANLNSLKGLKAHLYSDDGLTDLSFSFIPSSRFKSMIFETKGKRRFIPHLFPFSYFRAVDRYSAKGYISTSMPFYAFGHLITNASFTFEDGRIAEFSADEESALRLNTYIEQDEDAPRLAELDLTETFTEIADIPYFSYPEWDKLRGITLTLGSARSESVPFANEDEAIEKGFANSLFTLSIPLGTDLTLEIEDGNGDYDTLYSDGIIEDYQ